MNGFVGMIIGFILFPLSLYLLGTNEQNYVCTSKAIVYSDVESITASCQDTVEAGKLIFYSCPVDASSLPQWNVTTPISSNGTGTQPPSTSFASLYAERSEEVWACSETKKTTTKNKRKVTTYTYKVGWITRSAWKKPTQSDANSSSKCNSRNYNAIAPVQQGFDSFEKYAEEIKAGQFIIDTSRLKATSALTTKTEDTVYFPPDTCTESGGFGCQRYIYRSKSTEYLTGFASFQDSSTPLQPVPVQSSYACSATQFLRSYGGSEYEKPAFVETLNDQNVTQVWVLRFIGLILSIAGCYLCMSPIAAAADVMGDCLNMIPCVGSFLEDMLEGVVTTVLCGIACMVGCSCSLTVIAIMWLVMRPLYGAGMLVVVALCLFGAYSLRSSSGAPNKGKRKRGGGPGQAEMAQMPPQQGMMMAAPMATPMMQPQQYNIAVPPGAGPGAMVPFTTPDGRSMNATVPEGYFEGMMFSVMA